MARTLLVLTVLVPLVCFLLVKYQDTDFVLMIYELIGANPTVALHGKVVLITGASLVGRKGWHNCSKYGQGDVSECESVKDKQET